MKTPTLSTTRRYAQAIEHFEVEGGGLLPASATSVVRYLAAFGPRLSASTLRTNLAALVQWHLQRGFVDPTKAAQVRDTLRGIQALHTADQAGAGTAAQSAGDEH